MQSPATNAEALAIAERYRTLLEINNAIITNLTQETLLNAICEAIAEDRDSCDGLRAQRNRRDAGLFRGQFQVAIAQGAHATAQAAENGRAQERARRKRREHGWICARFAEFARRVRRPPFVIAYCRTARNCAGRIRSRRQMFCPELVLRGGFCANTPGRRTILGTFFVLISVLVITTTPANEREAALAREDAPEAVGT